MSKCPDFDLNINIPCCSNTRLKQVNYRIEGLKVYQDNEYFGQIIRYEGSWVTVKVDNGNRFMKGIEMDINLNAL